MTNAQQIHGHEILHLIHDAPAPFSRHQLESAVLERFGPEARFHTCSAEGMTLDQLLTFLLSRGKIVERSGCLAADLGQMCSGDGHHDH